MTEPTDTASCAHERIQTWRRTEDGKPAGLWSCVGCSLKFEPLADGKEQEDALMLDWLIESFSPMGLNIDGNHAWQWRGSPARLRGANMREAIRTAMNKEAA